LEGQWDFITKEYKSYVVTALVLIQWMTYFSKFVQSKPLIQRECFGRWIDILNNQIISDPQLVACQPDEPASNLIGDLHTSAALSIVEVTSKSATTAWLLKQANSV
jgi:hypothetical protein